MKDVLEKICAAYSADDDKALSTALDELLRQLISVAHSLGPAVATLQFCQAKVDILGILSKVDCKNGLANRAGFISAYLAYFETIASRREVDEANARLSDVADAHNL